MTEVINVVFGVGSLANWHWSDLEVSPTYEEMSEVIIIATLPRDDSFGPTNASGTSSTSRIASSKATQAETAVKRCLPRLQFQTARTV